MTKTEKAEIRSREAAMSEILSGLEADLKEIDEGEYWDKQTRAKVMDEIRWDIEYILRAREIKTVEAFLAEVREVTEYLGNFSESIKWDREYLANNNDIQGIANLNPFGVLTQGNIDSISSKLTNLSNMQKKRSKEVQYLIDQGNKLFSRLDANSDDIEELKKGIKELKSLRTKYVKDDAFVKNLSSEFSRACATLNRRGADRISPFYGGVAEEERRATMRHYGIPISPETPRQRGRPYDSNGGRYACDQPSYQGDGEF